MASNSDSENTDHRNVCIIASSVTRDGTTVHTSPDTHPLPGSDVLGDKDPKGDEHRRSSSMHGRRVA